MDNVIFPSAEVKLTANDGKIYNGKVTHNGAYSDKGPITLILTNEKRFERDDIAEINIINNSPPTHYSSRGGKKSQRRKNKRNTKRRS